MVNIQKYTTSLQISTSHWTFVANLGFLLDVLTELFCCDVKYKNLFSLEKDKHEGGLLI